MTNQLTAIDELFIKDILMRIGKYEHDTEGRRPAMDQLIRVMRDSGYITETSIEERIKMLPGILRGVMLDFEYRHLPDDGAKQTSKVFTTAMLSLCEMLDNEREPSKVNPKTLDELQKVANKIWEGKNLAVLFKIKENL